MIIIEKKNHFKYFIPKNISGENKEITNKSRMNHSGPSIGFPVESNAQKFLIISTNS